MFGTIFFAIIALFIGYKVYKVLGDTSYHTDISDKDKENLRAFKESIEKEIEAQIEEVKHIETATQAESELGKEQQAFFITLRKTDRTFTAEAFLNGANKAFSMVLTAISERDLGTLSQLTTEETYNKFQEYIDRLSMMGQFKSIIIVGVKEIKIVETGIREQIAHITVEITSEQITSIKDIASNTVVSGSETLVKLCEDRWTFERSLKDTTGVWKLANDRS